jgi:hypothetical protein
VADKSKLGALCVTCHFRHDASFNQKKRWFQAKIDGGVGPVGVQLHMFVQGPAVGRAIRGRESLLTSCKESDHDEAGACIGGGEVDAEHKGGCGDNSGRCVGADERGTAAGGGKVQVLPFGIFTVAEKSARQGRNPRTGEEITIPARKAVKLRASSGLAKAVANGEGEPVAREPVKAEAPAKPAGKAKSGKK